MGHSWKQWAVAGVGALAIGVVVFGATGAEAQSTARVRVVHMSPDGPAVDVLVDGQRAIADLAFKSATDYAALPAGDRNVKVTPANQNQTAVIDATLPLQAGRDLTVVAVGKVAEIGALPLSDDNRAPDQGNAKVRFVHASPDAPAVDIAVADGPVLFPNVAFKNASEYAQVPAGTYNLEVRAAGTQNVALRVPNVALQSGQNVTIFAAGLAADNTLAAVPVVYPTAGQGGASTMPRTGTGGSLLADTALTGSMLAVMAAALLAAGAGTLAVARRRSR